MRRLFHFTCIEHLSEILSSGVLTTTESNLSPTREHAGPDVVWLTTMDTATPDTHGLKGSGADKSRIRVTVEVPNNQAHKWIQWARARLMADYWMKSIIAVGGGTHGTWRVVTRPIPSAEWVEVLDTATGEVLWSKDKEGMS